MREILFRGKRIDNGEWIEGFYFQKQNPCAEDGKPVKHCISDLPPFGAEIIPETVGQYTGLKDKNGLRIFEGDILKEYRFGNKNFIHVVGFGEGAFGTSRVVNEKYDTYFIPFDDSGNIMCTWLESEVIGNIHDNPELLKEVR